MLIRNGQFIQSIGEEVFFQHPWKVTNGATWYNSYNASADGAWLQITTALNANDTGALSVACLTETTAIIGHVNTTDDVVRVSLVTRTGTSLAKTDTLDLFNGIANPAEPCVISLTDTRFLVGWVPDKDLETNVRGQFWLVENQNGTLVELDQVQLAATHNVAELVTGCKINNNQAVMSFRWGNAALRPTCVLLDVDGDTLTVSTPVAADANASVMTYCARFNDTQFIIMYIDTAGRDFQNRMGTIANGTITFGAQETLWNNFNAATFQSFLSNEQIDVNNPSQFYGGFQNNLGNFELRDTYSMAFQEDGDETYTAGDTHIFDNADQNRWTGSGVVSTDDGTNSFSFLPNYDKTNIDTEVFLTKWSGNSFAAGRTVRTSNDTTVYNNANCDMVAFNDDYMLIVHERNSGTGLHLWAKVIHHGA